MSMSLTLLNIFCIYIAGVVFLMVCYPPLDLEPFLSLYSLAIE